MSSRLRAHSWQAALPKPLPAEQGFDASEARLTRVRWVKGGFRGVAPQASALARLRHSPNRGQRRLHSSTRTSATFRDSRASRLAGASEGPCVTKTLPSHHKLAENTRQTCKGPRFDGRAIGSATTSLPIRVPRLLRRAVRCQGRIGEF